MTTVRAQLAAGVWAGALLGGLDGLRASSAEGVSWTLGTILAPMGLGLVLGVCVGAGLAAGALLLGLQGARPVAEGEEAVERWPARLLSSGMVLAVLAPLLYVVLGIPLGFANDFNRLVGVVMVAAGAAVVASPLIEALTDRLVGWLGRWLPRRGSWWQGSAWAGGFLAALLVPAGVVWFGTEIEVALGAAPFVGLCALLVGQWAGVAAARWSAWRWPKVGRWQWASPGLAVLGALLFATTVGAEPTRTNLLGASLLTPKPLQLLWRALDGDGDGYASALGGGDCDDTNAAISPVAVDVPGNGVDEDCSGVDARALEGAWSSARIEATPLGEVARPRNLLLITVEALRADAIDLGARSKTPTLASLASSSTLFERAYSPGPATHLTLTSMMTGRYPSRLAWKLDGKPPQEISEAATLADMLRARRYTTLAFVTPWVHRHTSRVKRGFGTFETAPEPGGSSQPLVDKALAALGQQPQDRPWFLWVHLVEPHWPHQSGSTGTLESGYRAEVTTADARIGRLLAALRARGDGERTMIVVTGDHGEALGAHGVKTHGVTLYEPEIRVPLLLHVPGAPAHRRADPVSLVDVLPTVLDALDVDSDAPWDGRTLMPIVLDDAPASPRVLFVESWNPLKPPEVWIAAIHGPWKLLRRIHTGQDELYDVVADPEERKDRRAEGGEVLEGLKLEASRFAGSNDWKVLAVP